MMRGARWLTTGVRGIGSGSLIAVLVAALSAPVASAAPARYVFEMCDSALPGGGTAGVIYAPHPRFGFGAENSCARPGGGLVLWQPQMPPGDGGDAGWGVPMKAAAGTSIESVTVTAAACAPWPSVAYVFSDAWPAGNCAADVRAFPVDEDFKGFAIHLACVDPNPYDGSQCSHGPWVKAHYFAAAVLDRTAPNLATPTGPLLEPGIKRGRQAITIDASDVGGGLTRVSIFVNGMPAAEPKGLPCKVAQVANLSMTGMVAAQPSPCPAQTNATWTLDTGSFPFHNGSNLVQLCAADFATLSDPNVSCTEPRAVSVDNSCSESPVGGGRVLSAQFSRSNAEQVTVGYGKGAEVVGRLADEAGDPIRGARLCVKSQTIGVDREAAAVGMVVTNADGRYGYEVPAGPNREVTVGYRHDTLQVAKDVRYYAHVRPTMRVGRPEVENGSRVRFWGQLPGPSGGGRVVVLQAGTVGSKRWITFRRATADGRGVFRAGYRFSSTTQRTRYRFRAVVPRQAGYPWVEGHSRPVRVLVRP